MIRGKMWEEGEDTSPILEFFLRASMSTLSLSTKKLVFLLFQKVAFGISVCDIMTI